MSYSERSYSGDVRSYSSSPHQVSYTTHTTTTSQPVVSSYSATRETREYTTTSQREYSSSQLLSSQREYSGSQRDLVSSTRAGEGRIVGDNGPPRGCGFLSISYTWDHVNLRNLHTWQTYTYQASEGRDHWLRTYEEDQEWLRKLAEEGHRPTPAPRDPKWDRPWIGAIVVTTDPSVVILKDCIREGPADLAFLDDDDKIIGFGDATITDTASFNRAFRQYAVPEKEVQVTYLEGGRGSPKTTTLRVLSMGHKEEHLHSLRSRGLKETTDQRRRR